MSSPRPAPRPASAALGAALALALLAPAAAPGQAPPARPGTRSGMPVTKTVPSAAEQVAETERAFARAARERGIRDAFLQYMADEGILFRPDPITARVWLVTNPPTPGVLAWEPAWGAASAAGDVGFTTGPYTYRRAETDTAPGHGQYVTVWLRQEGGGYRALLDMGVPGPETPFPAAGSFAARPLAAVAARPASGASASGIAEATRATLFIADRGLAAASADDPAAALAAVAAPDVRVLRAGRAPLVGPDSLPALAAPGARWTFQTRDARVARSGDLGVTYGSYERRDAAGAERGNYVRVWTREPAGWRVLLDMAAPAR